MKGGKITITNKLKVREIGHSMNDGDIVYEGDMENANIGEKMLRGRIVVNGTIKGDSHVGTNMKNGEIILNNYHGVQYNNLCGLGQGMEGGRILVQGSVHGNGHLGWSMVGGFIDVGGKIEGEEFSVGAVMSGNSRIKVNSDCLVYTIGELMKGGKIEIAGNASCSIGGGMKEGEIVIGGNVYQVRRNTQYSLGWAMERGKITVGGNVPDVGSSMEGGLIIIGGNVQDAGQEMKGGVIKINGYLENKKYIVKLGGHIYEKGVEVKPKLAFRAMGGLFKMLDRE